MRGGNFWSGQRSFLRSGMNGSAREEVDVSVDLHQVERFFPQLSRRVSISRSPPPFPKISGQLWSAEGIVGDRFPMGRAGMRVLHSPLANTLSTP